MQCKQADSLIDAYMDGEMAGELKSALRHHAESCADCRARIGEERVLRARLAALPIEGPADGFFEQALRAAKVAQPDELTGARRARSKSIALMCNGSNAFVGLSSVASSNRCRARISYPGAVTTSSSNSNSISCSSRS